MEKPILELRLLSPLSIGLQWAAVTPTKGEDRVTNDGLSTWDVAGASSSRNTGWARRTWARERGRETERHGERVEVRRGGLAEDKQLPSLRNTTTALHVTKLSGRVPASCSCTWCDDFQAFPKQLCKDRASNPTSPISFPNLSLNTKVEPEGLQCP